MRIVINDIIITLVLRDVVVCLAPSWRQVTDSLDFQLIYVTLYIPITRVHISSVTGDVRW